MHKFRKSKTLKVFGREFTLLELSVQYFLDVELGKTGIDPVTQFKYCIDGLDLSEVNDDFLQILDAEIRKLNAQPKSEDDDIGDDDFTIEDVVALCITEGHTEVLEYGMHFFNKVAKTLVEKEKRARYNSFAPFVQQDRKDDEIPYDEQVRLAKELNGVN